MTNSQNDQSQGLARTGLRFPIPSSLGLPGTFLMSDQPQEARFKTNRNMLIQGLEGLAGATGLASAAGQVATSHGGDLYKAVTGPLQMIDKGPPGLYRGVRYADGKILFHAKFIKARPELMLAATNCATQVMLISVAVQLNQIQNTIKEVQQEIEIVEEYLHNDRIAEIVAGISSFQQSLDIKDEKKREESLLHAVQLLNEGVSKTVVSLRTEIGQVPEAATKISNVLRAGSMREKAKVKMAMAEESFSAALYGIQAMAESYSMLGETTAAANTLKSLIGALSNVGIEEAITKSRMLPYDGQILPEAPWSEFRDNTGDFLEMCSKLRYLGVAGSELVGTEISDYEQTETQKVQEVPDIEFEIEAAAS